MSTSMAEALREYDNNVVLKLCWEQSLNEAGNPLRNSKGNLVFKCGFQGNTGQQFWVSNLLKSHRRKTYGIIERAVCCQ